MDATKQGELTMSAYQLREEKDEAREVKQSKYGSYCQMCKKLGKEPVSYHSFCLYMLEQLKIKNK